MDILTFNTINAESYCKSLVKANGIQRYLLNYHLPENLFVKSTTETQYIAASAKNRYIKSVTVEPISTTLTVTPTTSVQTFTSGPYSTVTVNAVS